MDASAVRSPGAHVRRTPRRMRLKSAASKINMPKIIKNHVKAFTSPLTYNSQGSGGAECWLESTI